MEKILSQSQMSPRTVKNIIVSGNINFNRRKKDDKQLVISSSTSTKNPFKSLGKVKYLFEKYEKNNKRENSTSVSVSERAPEL